MTDDVAHQRERWTEIQEELAAEVSVEASYVPQRGDVVLGLDIQYAGERAHVAGDLSHWEGEHIGTYAGVVEVEAPYISGFFCFREGPPLLALLAALEGLSLPRPELLIVDGHGLAHPRRFGAACWVGVATGIPTLGCAKDTLLRFEGELQEERGSTVDVRLEDERVGVVLRRIHGVRPVYVSPGHGLDLETSIEVVQKLPSRFRIPDPIRHADRAARAHSKGRSDPTWHDLGTLAPVPAPWDS